jgi:hypothetical protein
MKKLFLFAAAILFLLCACEKKDDPDLGEFRDWESYIDMSQKNIYREGKVIEQWLIRHLEGTSTSPRTSHIGMIIA